MINAPPAPKPCMPSSVNEKALEDVARPAKKPRLATSFSWCSEKLQSSLRANLYWRKPAVTPAPEIVRQVFLDNRPEPEQVLEAPAAEDVSDVFDSPSTSTQVPSRTIFLAGRKDALEAAQKNMERSVRMFEGIPVRYIICVEACAGHAGLTAKLILFSSAST